MADPTSSSTTPPPIFRVPDGNLEQGGIRDLMTDWIADDLKGEALFDAYLESMHPAVLFHEKCLASPTLFFKQWDILLRRGVEVRKQRGLIVLNALIELYPYEAVRNLAKSLVLPRSTADSSTASDKTGGLAAAAAPTSRRQGDRNGHQVATKYNDYSSKYSGSIGESWNDYSQSYRRYLQDCKISTMDGLKFLHNALRGEALRFFTNEPPFVTLDRAMGAIEDVFNSRTRQNQVKNELSCLRLPVIMSSKAVSTQEGLEHIRSEISSKIYLCPVEYCSESHKRQYLRDAVVGLEWSLDSLGIAESGNWTFQTLFSDLYASIGAHEEGLVAVQRDKLQTFRSGRSTSSPGVLSGLSTEMNPTILFDGQSKYAVHPKKTLARLQIRPYPGKRVLLCFNCKSPDHFMAKCDKPISAEQAARRAFRKVNRMESAKEAIIHLAEQYGFTSDGSISDASSDSPRSVESSPEESLELEELNFVHFNKLSEGPAPSQAYESTSETSNFEVLLKNSILQHSRMDSFTSPVTGSISEDQEIYITDSPVVPHNELKSMDETFDTFKVAHKNYSSSRFQGCCVDTGAQSSVIGLKQTESYCRHTGIDYQPLPSPRNFKFSNSAFKSLGKLPIRIPVPQFGFIEQLVDFLDAEIPLLLLLDVLYKEGIYVNNVVNALVHHKDGWTMPLLRKFGHMFLEWPEQILFTSTELQHMHKHFFHPSATKMYNLIKRAAPEQASSETLRVLQEISKKFDPCQRLGTKPITFQVSMPDGIVFNQQLALDLMLIESSSLLHVFDTQTHFFSAQFLTGESVEDVWYAFLTSWATLYVGFPDCFLVDQGSVFTSALWAAISEAASAEIHFAPTESHKSLVPVERYHSPLRRIFLKIRMDFPNIDRNLVLSLANKAMNDTCGPEGLVPAYLCSEPSRVCR